MTDITIDQDIAVIRECVEQIRSICTDPKHLDLILAHLADIDADAEILTGRLAEAEARVNRLQLYLMVVERAYDRPDVREIYNAAVIPEQRLQPGDVRTDDDHLPLIPEDDDQ